MFTQDKIKLSLIKSLEPSDFKISLERNAFKFGFYLAKIFKRCLRDDLEMLGRCSVNAKIGDFQELLGENS